ncbi:MAG: SDR family oxidoreductase [Acidobacteriaceae bacterium]|nr:SDR family oxidoreductase [Acidobacteriaceae bacterium]MBV9441139.1 SDR family oxidoreductase [Acidobacteriaceae bacterium]
MKTAVVTGTSTGIGLATAATLARAGHTVYATMRDPKTGGEELRAIAEREHLPLHIAALDVDSDESVRNAFVKILAEAGRIDVLVNNAGISGIGPVEENPIAAFRATMETNYFGGLRCIQAVLPGMRERRSGCIVNVTSVTGRLSVAANAAYSSSKFALESASESLAQEVKAFGVRVAIVEPGVIATPIFGKVQPPSADSNYPHGRRIYELFRTSLENPVSPYVVGEKIREIVESGTWKLRHPVGPDAEGFLAWRASMSDEQWVEWGALSDEQWVEYVRQNFHLNVNL